MTPAELTPNERLTLLVLMAESREVSNVELKRIGPELTAPSRRRLNEARLIESDTSVRPFTHELTDRGWALCAEILAAGPPERSLGAARALYTVLAGLHRHFARSDQRLSEVFLPPENDAPSGVVAQLRAAYNRLATGPGAFVGLAAVRGELPSVPRSEVDDALRELQRAEGISLIPQENQKTLTQQDIDAAIDLGGQRNHLLAIELA